MLTDQQLTETALRLVDTELGYLTTYDMNGPIGELLCEQHCTLPECGHDPAESAQEIETTHAHIKAAAAVLRADLARYAAARNITVPTTN